MSAYNNFSYLQDNEFIFKDYRLTYEESPSNFITVTYDFKVIDIPIIIMPMGEDYTISDRDLRELDRRLDNILPKAKDIEKCFELLEANTASDIFCEW